MQRKTLSLLAAAFLLLGAASCKARYGCPATAAAPAAVAKTAPAR